MDFEGRSLTFQEADRRYASLKRQRDAGTITDEEFDQQLKGLMVLDDEGRWWAKSRSTGEWLYHDGAGWVSAVPPSESHQAPEGPSQASSSPSSSRRLLWTFAIIGGVVILVGIVASSWWFNLQRASQVATQQGGQQERQQPQREQRHQDEKEQGQAQGQGGVEKTPTPQPDDGQKLGVGDSVTAGNLRVTLEGLRVLPRNPGIDMPVQSPDNIFLALRLTLENLSSGSITVRDDEEFALETEEGDLARQAVHTQQVLLEEELGPGPSGPGNAGEGEIVYEVPPEREALQLVYDPPGDSLPTYTWHISASDFPELANAASASASSASPDASATPASASPASESGVEAQVQAAAESYYQAVAARDWGYTYDHLDSETRSAFTEDEWFAKNNYFADQGSATYTIQSVEMDSASPESLAYVGVLLTFGDGSTTLRNTYFVYEDGSWKHKFSQEEYEQYMPGTPYEEFVAAQQ